MPENEHYEGGNFLSDIMEVVGPDTPVLDGHDTPERHSRRGRVNRVFENMRDMAHLAWPDPTRP